MQLFTSLPGLLLFLLLLWMIYPMAKRQDIFAYFWVGMSVKIFAGLFLGWLYYNYYGAGDTLSFMEDAVKLRELAFDEPSAYLNFLWSDHLNPEFAQLLHYDSSSPRALFFDKLISILNLICLDHYWLISINISLLSFAGFYYLAAKLSNHFPKGRNAAIIALLFMPSVVLWSSGVVKESVAVSSICVVCALALNSQFTTKYTSKIIQYLLILVFLWLSWQLKYYYTALVIPALFAPVILYRLGRNGKFSALLYSYRIAAWIFIWAIMIISVSNSQLNLGLHKLPQVIKINHDAFVLKSSENDYIQYNTLEDTWGSVLQNAPLALWSGLFRPFFTDINNIPKIFAALENMLLLVLLLFQWKKLIPGLRSEENLWLLSALVYCIGLAIFLSLAAPNFGTLVRYKSGYSFLFAYLILFDHPIFRLQKKIKQNE